MCGDSKWDKITWYEGYYRDMGSGGVLVEQVIRLSNRREGSVHWDAK